MDEENNGGDASEANDENQDTISILSDISKEEVPNQTSTPLNIFLQKAMNQNGGSIKRGNFFSAKAYLTLRIGQKQARRTEYSTLKTKRGLGEVGRVGTRIHKLVSSQGSPHPIVLQETETHDSYQ